tara:strand:- start:541 stop:975 length:435 start_codon:yes stop_codon:yes gene_type:complete
MPIPKNGDLDSFRVSLVQTLAQHDSAITTLGGRMSGVEGGLNSLQKEMHTGFTSVAASVAALGSQMDRADARPQVDYHKTISSIVAIAVLFSMIVAGIIWITTSQFGSVIAEQKGFNAAVKSRLDKVEDVLGSWKTRVVETGRK